MDAGAKQKMTSSGHSEDTATMAVAKSRKTKRQACVVLPKPPK